MPSIPHMPWMSPDSQDMFAKNIADARFKFILAFKSFLHWIMAFVGPSVVSFTAKVGRSFPQHIMLFLPESCRDGENINFTLHKHVQMCAHMLKYYISKLQRRQKHRTCNVLCFTLFWYKYVQNISTNIKCCFSVPYTKGSVSVLRIGPRLYIWRFWREGAWEVLPL